MIAPSIRIEEVAYSLVDAEAFYSLNFQFKSYDNTGTRLTAERCKTSIADLVTNTFWQQMFTIPRAAVGYRMVQTPSAQQNGFTEIWDYQSTAATTVIVGPLTTINLGLAPHDVRVFPVADATATRTIAYGTENLVAVTLRNQGVTNRVQLLIYLTPLGESELLLREEELDLGPFDVVEQNVELLAANRGSYQLRVGFHSLDLPETHPDDNQVILTMTNEPPRVDGTRVSVLAEHLPLRIPLTAWDPNGDPLFFQLEPSSGADLDGQELVFDNGGAAGSYDLVVTASDGELSSAPSVVTVDVYTDQAPALPPQISSSD